MITYTEKGIGLHEAIKSAGHWLMHVDGVWQSSNDVVVQQIIDAYDPLPRVQKDMWDAIQAERESRKLAGRPLAGKRFHSDSDSRIQQLGLAMLGANIPAGLMWKTMDGSFIEMTPTLAQQIFIYTAQRDTAIFAAAEVHRGAMLALSWQDALQYDYSQGWPE
jgi:hypothetical protein